jgi:tetratricopeptide (TPR) repeat protein
VAALEVRYEADAAPGLVARLPFVGRQGDLARLVGLLGETAAGHGGLLFVAGEPGIGKTRLTEELAEAATADGFSVLWGHCLDGDWFPPYAPFAEVVEALAGGLAPEELRLDLGTGGAALAQLVPTLRQRLPDLPDAAPVQPDEERFRLLDAMAQFLAARARRAPVLLCLDDLHWADGSTVAMLRHVVRSSPGQRVLVIGTYRDAEVGAGHPLHDAIGGLRREVEFERLKLEGLEAKAVGELLEALADHDVLGSVAAAIAAETDGNPFFIKEVLRHLLEEGRFFRGPDGRWTSDGPVAELGIPEGDLSDAAYVCSLAGGQTQAWALAARGLAHAGKGRDVAWARMVSFDHERRAAADPEHPGIPLDTPERAEAARILRDAHLDPMGPGPIEAVFHSRDEALTSSNLSVLAFWAGEYDAALPQLEIQAQQALARGQLARAARCFAFVGGCHVGQGRLDEGRRALEQGQALAARVGQPIFVVLQVQEILSLATDEGMEALAAVLTPLATAKVPAIAWALGYVYADLARIGARTDQEEMALHYLGLLVPWLERAPAWSGGFQELACHAAEVLWALERLDHVAVVEQALREKVVRPDFRYAMVDGRLALARVCALQGRHEEAQKWLGEAREVLTEQGARPLLAIADYDEALMYARRRGPGDAERARPLLDAARAQFETIGMTGWSRRAEDLAARLG